MMSDAMSQTQRSRKHVRSLHCSLDLRAAFLDTFCLSLRYICTKLGPLPACLPNLSCVCLMAVFRFILGYGQMCHAPERRGFAAGQCHGPDGMHTWSEKYSMCSIVESNRMCSSQGRANLRAWKTFNNHYRTRRFTVTGRGPCVSKPWSARLSSHIFAPNPCASWKSKRTTRAASTCRSSCMARARPTQMPGPDRVT
jgi:hypothetical protein